MANKKSYLRLKPKNFLIITIAGIINAIGVTLFLYPVKLYDSGISGLSMLLDQTIALPLALFLVALNIPIFIFGFKKQGLTFTIYSIYAVIVYSVSAYLITNVLPIDNSMVSPLAGQDLLLCAIFGGIISGIGSGITIRYGGAIDGLDVLSVIFAKKLGLSLGTFVLIFNTLLYIVCGICIESWILPLYSIITYFVGSKTIDFIVDGFNGNKCAMIVTTKPNELITELASAFSSTGTVVKAQGGYSKENKTVIYFIIDHFQINKLKGIVTSIDPDAFVTLTEISDVIKKQSV